MTTEWRVCQQNHNYLISNTGLCKSAHVRFEGKYLTPVHTGYSDMYVLCEKYDKKKYRIQNLVYTAFVGNVPKGYVVYNIDGNLSNNNIENLAIMPLADSIFLYAPRQKKLPKMIYYNQYIFVINGRKYKSSGDVIKDYPNMGTRQNLCKQTDRWIRGEAARGKEWNPEGFIIRGTLIWATKTKVKNKTKKRMDRIKNTYKLNKLDSLIEIKG